MQRFPLSRRKLMGLSGLGLASAVIPSQAASAQDTKPATDAKVLRFGAIADVHQDVMHDGVERVTAFVKQMQTQQVDFIIQLGDFCQPHEKNRDFMKAWQAFEGDHYHVIGNHDTDGGYARKQTVDFYGMPGQYYSFVKKGVRFIVLDGNDKGGKLGGYPRYIAKEQQTWLQQTLEQAEEPIVVAIHQPLDSTDGVENRAEIRAMLEAKNQAEGPGRVIAVLAGHSHIDYCQHLNGIHYVLVNSSSYQWVGGKYKHQSYPKAIHDNAPWVAYTCPYEEPLWAVLTIDIATGAIEIEGASTRWVGPNPVEAGVNVEEYRGWDPLFSQPRISSWRLPLTTPGDLQLKD